MRKVTSVVCQMRSKFPGNIRAFWFEIYIPISMEILNTLMGVTHSVKLDGYRVSPSTFCASKISRLPVSSCLYPPPLVHIYAFMKTGLTERPFSTPDFRFWRHSLCAKRCNWRPRQINSNSKLSIALSTSHVVDALFARACFLLKQDCLVRPSYGLSPASPLSVPMFNVKVFEKKFNASLLYWA